MVLKLTCAPVLPANVLQGHILRGGNANGTAATENSVKVPPDPAVPLLGIYPKAMKSGSQKRSLHCHMHCSISPKSQEMEANTMSLDG